MKSKSVTRGVAPLLCVGAILSFMLTGCILVHSSAISQSTGGGALVSAEDSDYGILRLTKPQSLTSTVNADLLRRCQSDLLTNVQTELSMRDWFLIVQYYTVTASAVCKPPPPPPAPPPPPVTSGKVVLRGVHFDFNKYNIRPEDAAVLDDAAAALKNNPNMNVEVNGYCDSTGNADYNLKLSEKRADSVADYLEKDGIPAGRLTPHGYGKTNFVASNSTKEGRAQNRRVELVPAQ